MLTLVSVAAAAAVAAPAVRRSTTAPYPSFSQQCVDDAGPVFGDDDFGAGTLRHSWPKLGAKAILKPDGSVAKPIQAAIDSRGVDATTAYLEGPLSCGGRGWFCRILPDETHFVGSSPSAYGDMNFNHCNASDYGDTGGHCHGSDDDDVYYWWVRDHWHRNYAGRLKCCCDWQAVTQVVARCDYRAPLKPGENEQCRDANEDHAGPGTGFLYGYEGGCPNLGGPVIEPADDQCWEVSKFAPGNDSGGDGGDQSGGNGESDGNESEGESSVDGGDESGEDGESDGNESEGEDESGEDGESDGNESEGESSVDGGDESGEDGESDGNESEPEEGEGDESGGDEASEDEGDDEGEIARSPCALPRWKTVRNICAGSLIDNQCQRAVTKAAAVQICSAVNARLCSVAELKTKVAKGTGCNLDSKSVWALDDDCKNNLSRVAKGKHGKQPRCLGASKTAGVRCCANV